MAAETILDELKWYGNPTLPARLFKTPQTVPTHEELLAFPGEETGDTIETRWGYEAEKHALPEGRDNRTYALDSPDQSVNVTYVPDQQGFYIETLSGTKYRPQDLDEVHTLLEEMDHQIDRYGDLL